MKYIQNTEYNLLICRNFCTGYIDAIFEDKRFTNLFTVSNFKTNDKVIFDYFVN